MESVGRKKAIRLKCLECTCQSEVEVRYCPCKDCPLWPWRMGYETNADGERVKKRESPLAKNNA